MKKFAVLGHPVAHSLSPTMHAANFASIGFDATYEKFDVEPEKLADFIKQKQAEGYSGLNITVPHKIAVIPLLDRLDESVKRYGACNTIKFEQDGMLTGYNTDVIGFVTGLAAHGYALAGKKVFIVGCGGAGSALATACCYEKAASLTVADLDAPRISSLADRLRALGTGTEVTALLPVPEKAPGAGVCGADLDASKALWGRAAESAEIVVNATPMGLHPGEPPALPPDCFHPGQFVLDIVPTKDFPPTAAAAVKAGATATDGLEFLVGQGAKSFEIWTGVTADRKAMLAAIR